MKRVIFLLLTLVSFSAFAQKANMRAYIKGTVPVVDGSVVFDKTLKVSDKSKSELFANLLAFTQNSIKDSEYKDDSKITLKDEGKGVLVANIFENMYFKKKSWVTDAAVFKYRMLIACSDGKVNVKVRDISYDYEGDTGIKAEKWITDEYALTKDGRQLRKDTGKFRRFTIDRVKSLMTQIEQAAKE